ncbi:alanine--tRNA ligase [Candidatus Marsarchaeota archaeon]|nr:alanine--tRNA ligase [Candidatus Marsarchaeota archaeon]MCL5404730.1 alanine--tRNA ligase [Candidatus Marsarchaeota archaeon]
MLDKESLRKEFSEKPELYYSTKLFEREGFIRKQCKGCGKFFWTADESREYCGDSEHEGYSFMKKDPEEVSLEKFWSKFSKFFEDNGHAVIERYPVVSRWRQDLYFTIASIQDFQRIENGVMSFEYNANPLLVPQMCLRFNDIPNVGVTGRHFTSFIMAGQTAFNYPKEGYWRDRTMELNYEVLTKIVGVKKKDLTYVEDVWAMGDFSEFGPSIEAFSGGLEMVNNVFTQFEYNNEVRRELSGKVVDVGWGLERLVWFKSGSQTAYDQVFKEALDYIHKESGIRPNTALYSKVAGQFGKIDLSESKSFEDVELKVAKAAGISMEEYTSIIKPMQAAYAIADHAKTLLFAITDGALPSNVGGGYNLRVILRRIFDFRSRYRMSFDMRELMEIIAKSMSHMYPELSSSIDELEDVIRVEKERYENTMASAIKTINGIIDRHEKITPERMRVLYESNGITPDLVNGVAASRGVTLELPESSYSSIIKGDFTEKPNKKDRFDLDVSGIKKTEKLFYNFALESDSKVLLCSSDMVVLDKTPFYAESGGQEADHGTIDGIKVKDVQSQNGVIVHLLEGRPNFKVGSKVHCLVDRKRRMQLIAHHTATHLISAAARSVLGKHAWQEGAHKGVAKAHIDIAHYEKLSDKQIKEIEATANSYLQNGIRVTMKEMDRNEAESKFGFSIYQGHGIPVARPRIVEITDMEGNMIDAEACGGIHAMGIESIIGTIKIIGSQRIHDGIDRLEYVAGLASYKHINSMEEKLLEAERILGTDSSKLTDTLSQMSKQLSEYKSAIESMKSEKVSQAAEKLLSSNEKSMIYEMDYDIDMLRQIATKVVDTDSSRIIILHNKSGNVVCISGNDSGKDASEFIKSSLAKLKAKEFRGGGSKRIAQGMLIK